MAIALASSLLSVAQGMQLGWNTLSTVPAVVMVKVTPFLRKDGEWRFPPLAAEQALHYLSQLIEGIVKECPRHCWCYLKVAARG